MKKTIFYATPWSSKRLKTVVIHVVDIMANKQYDFAVFGASGFTGQFVVEELAKMTRDKKYKWAVAGRNETELRKILEESTKIIGKFYLMFHFVYI